MHVTTDAGPFAIVPMWVLDAAEPQALRLYALLAGRYANRDGVAYPSRGTLAKNLDVGERTIDRAIHDLETIGALFVTRRSADDGEHQTNLYRVQSVAPSTATDVPTPSELDVATPGATDVAQSKGNSEPNPSEPKEPQPSAHAHEGQASLMENPWPEWITTLRSIDAWQDDPALDQALRMWIVAKFVEWGLTTSTSYYAERRARDLAAWWPSQAPSKRGRDPRRTFQAWFLRDKGQMNGARPGAVRTGPERAPVTTNPKDHEGGF